MKNKIKSMCCGGAVNVVSGCPDWIAKEMASGSRTMKRDTNYYVCDNPKCNNYRNACDVGIKGEVNRG